VSTIVARFVLAAFMALGQTLRRHIWGTASLGRPAAVRQAQGTRTSLWRVLDRSLRRRPAHMAEADSVFVAAETFRQIALVGTGARVKLCTFFKLPGRILYNSAACHGASKIAEHH
jgi:hypothetical protein